MNSRYSQEFLDARRAELLQQKTDLENQLKQIARYDQAAGVWAPIQPDYDSGSPEDSIDSGVEAEALQENQAETVDLEKSLLEVTRALDKLADHTYGKCEITGDWIDEARLVAYPAARTCSDD